MKDKPKVGQIVCLNDHGIDQIGGLKSSFEVRDASNMLITSVSEHSITNDVDTFVIKIEESNRLSRYMLDNHCVDLIK